MAEPLSAVEIGQNELSGYLSTARSLEREGGARHDHYRELEEAFAGQMASRKTHGVWERVFNRILPWYSDNNKLRPVVTVNFARQIVGSRRAQIGVTPQVRGVPSSTAAPDVTAAETRERIAYSGWRENLIGKRLSDLGFYCSLYGTAVTQVHNDLRAQKMRYLVRSPSGCYPVPIDDDGDEMAECYFVTEVSARTANARWPDKGLDRFGNAPLRIIEVITPDVHLQACEEAKGYLLEGQTNALGKVMVSTVPNIGIPGSLWGDSDLEDILELQREYNRRLALETEMILRTLYAPLVIVNPVAVPKRIPYGPGAHIAVHQGGDVHPVQMASLAYNWPEGYGRIQKLIEYMSDTIPQQWGEMDSDIVTGKAFTQSMGPNVNRAELRNQVIDPKWELTTRYWLEAMEKLYSGKTQTVFGKLRGAQYAFEYDPAELEGSYDVEVYRDAASFFDANTRWILGMQAVGQGVLSKLRFMQFFPWIEDSTAELEQIRKERQSDLEDAMMANAIQQGMAPPDVGTVSGSVEGMAAGQATSPEVPIPMAGGENIDVEELLGSPESEPELEGSENEPPEVMRVARILMSIENVTGRMWLVGEFLERGDPNGPAGIEVMLEDMNDKATLQNALRKADPDNYGNYVFLPLPEGQTEPKQHSMEVTPPGAGIDKFLPEMGGGAGGLEQGTPAMAGEGRGGGQGVGL